MLSYCAFKTMQEAKRNHFLLLLRQAWPSGVLRRSSWLLRPFCYQCFPDCDDSQRPAWQRPQLEVKCSSVVTFFFIEWMLGRLYLVRSPWPLPTKEESPGIWVILRDVS